MTNHRHVLSDAQWALVQLALPTGRRGPKSRLRDRNFIDAVPYRAKTSIAWRDLPERLGTWKTVYNKFARWSYQGHWAKIFKALQIHVDDECVIIDSSIVRAHQDTAGGKGGIKTTHWVVLELSLYEDPRAHRRARTAAPRRNHARSASTNRRSPKGSSEVTLSEGIKNIKAALQSLRRRVGSWAILAKSS